MPCARAPTVSLACARATSGAEVSAKDARDTSDMKALRIAFNLNSPPAKVWLHSMCDARLSPRAVNAVCAVGGSSAARQGQGFLSDEDGGGDDGGPEAFLVAHGALGDVLNVNDLVGQPVDLLLFVPALIRVELETERRRQHIGGKLLGVVAGDVLALAEAVMLGEVAVQLAVAWDRDADSGSNQPMRLPGGGLGHDDEGDLPGLE